MLALLQGGSTIIELLVFLVIVVVLIYVIRLFIGRP